MKLAEKYNTASATAGTWTDMVIGDILKSELMVYIFYVNVYNVKGTESTSDLGLSCSGCQCFRCLSLAIHPYLSVLDESLRRFSLDLATTLDFPLTSRFRSSITIVTFPIAGT